MKTLSPEQCMQIIEAALMVAGRPLTIAQLQKLFDEHDSPETSEIRDAISALQEKYTDHGIEIQEVASGFQCRAKSLLSPWISKLWEERPPRYSRALLETLALIAYRQPITRAEIEDIRGVSASSNIVKTLMERDWIRIIGYRDIPGKPGLYATTKTFLDYFNLKNLDQLPPLAEFTDFVSKEELSPIQLELPFTIDEQVTD